MKNPKVVGRIVAADEAARSWLCH